jgi:hypothetical protein
MKSLFRRPALVLALLAGVVLAACGGKAMFTVGGVIEKNTSYAGLLYSGLVLTDGGNSVTVPAGATTFAFPNQIAYGSTYNVVVGTQPLHETCAVANGADTAGRMAAIGVVVACNLNAYTIGGTVTGLTVDGLVLINGSSGGAVTVNASTTADLPVFTFGAVTYGVAYGVSVLTQPAGLTCTVAPNGTGVMGDATITTIGVSCVPRALGG